MNTNPCLHGIDILVGGEGINELKNLHVYNVGICVSIVLRRKSRKGSDREFLAVLVCEGLIICK